MRFIVQRLQGISPIIDAYDAFVLDQWGVLHDGNTLYDGVTAALELLAEHGKTVLILTNSSKTEARNISRLEAKFGLGQEHYRQLVSSAQLLRDTIGQRSQKLFVVADEGDEVLFEGTAATPTGSLDAADGLALLSVEPGSSLEDHRHWLEAALDRGLPMYCPSADTHSVRPDGVVLGMAAVIEFFRSQGGSVTNFGKPEPAIYRHCTEILTGTPVDRILAVGDQLASDVLGAKQAGWDSLLVETGAGARSLSAHGEAGPLPEFVLSSLKP